MIGMLIVALAAVPIAMRFGVDSIASSKPPVRLARLDHSGGDAVQISIIGWNSLLLIFFAKSTTQLLRALGMIGEGGAGSSSRAPSCWRRALVFLVLLRGSAGVDRVAKILVAHVFVGDWMLYILVTQRWDDLVSAVPAYASTEPALELHHGHRDRDRIAAVLVALYRRDGPHGSERSERLPCRSWWAWVLPSPSSRLIGIAGILVLQVSDPSEWMRSVGGPIYGVIALLFVAAANLGTAVAGVYSSSIGLRHFPALQHLHWPTLLLISILPVGLVGLLIPDLFFANFGTFLAFIGLGFAPLCGIQITDYYLLRGRKIDVRGLFEGGPASTYAYWGGFNPASILGMAAGVGTYLYLLNPITYDSRWPYEFLTASLPTAVVAGVVYAIVTLVVNKPAGKGGY